MPFSSSSILAHILRKNSISEQILEISYACQIKSLNIIPRNSINVSDHEDAILTVAFSPGGSRFCSGSGDGHVYFWDSHLSLKTTRIAHDNWVLTVKWSPDEIFCASGGMDDQIYVWKNALKSYYSCLRGHSGWISCLTWEPCHLSYPCRRLASGSRDCSIRVWDTLTGMCPMILSSHSASVRTLRWSGNGYIYSGSADGTIKVWNAIEGSLVQTLRFHRRWVNSLTLSTDYMMQYDPFDYTLIDPSQNSHISSFKKTIAEKKYRTIIAQYPERMVSSSDDSSMFLWCIPRQYVPQARMVGHLRPINEVCFSPDSKWLVSASFDCTIKLWRGLTGHFIGTFVGHTAPVYTCSWSPNSSLVVSGSRDGLLKIWSIEKKQVLKSLSGHNGDIFVIDWSPNGSSFVSGSKDGLLKLWNT
jgi:ribosome assembly protein 4